MATPEISTASPVNLVSLRASAEAARGVNLTRPKGKRLPFSMNPEAVIWLCDYVVSLQAVANEWQRTQKEAWECTDRAKAELAVSVRRQADLEAANTHIRERNEGVVRGVAALAKANKQLLEDLAFAKKACAAAWEACHADRQLRSSDAGAALEAAWPMLCLLLGRPEHEPGQCAFQCDGIGHTLKTKQREALAAIAAAAAAAEGATDAPQA